MPIDLTKDCFQSSYTQMGRSSMQTRNIWCGPCPQFFLMPMSGTASFPVVSCHIPVFKMTLSNDMFMKRWQKLWDGPFIMLPVVWPLQLDMGVNRYMATERTWQVKFWPEAGKPVTSVLGLMRKPGRKPTSFLGATFTPWSVFTAWPKGSTRIGYQSFVTRICIQVHPTRWPQSVPSSNLVSKLLLSSGCTKKHAVLYS